MKMLAFLTLLLATKIYAADPEIQKVKSLFEAAAHSKDAADQLVKLLSATNQSSPPLLVCYKGAAEMMKARYEFNPIHKFKSFRKGKFLIEQAVKEDPDNTEIRFLRFAIQTNLPAFLNYNDNIQEDKKYLLDNLQTTKDNKLKQNIVKCLSASKYCSGEDKKRLAT